jgi:hypothetical protein
MEKGGLDRYLKVRFFIIRTAQIISEGIISLLKAFGRAGKCCQDIWRTVFILASRPLWQSPVFAFLSAGE